MSILSDNRIAEMIKLKESGMSFRDIGKQFGVSGQRVHQLIGDNYKELTLDEAIQELIKTYNEAKDNNWVKNPLGYAFYHVWRLVDKQRKGC